MKKAVLSALVILCSILLFGEGGKQAELFSDGTIGEVRPAAASAWMSIGPFGGEVKALARNPKFPNELYASFGSYPSQFFRSTDGAKSWTRTALIQENVADIVADPKNANVVYAYANRQIFRSSDRGMTFPEAFSLPTDFRGYGGRMAIHPENPMIIIVTGMVITNESGSTYCPAVARTKDGGTTWTVTTFEPKSLSGQIFDIGIHPKNPNVVYICGDFYTGRQRPMAVYRSSNGGGSYKNIAKDPFLSSHHFYTSYALALHPTDPNTLYIACNNGIAWTENAGSTWQVQTSPSGFEMGAIALDSVHPSTLYGLGASSDAGVRGCWKSTDGGRTWRLYDNGIYGSGRRLLADGSAIIAGTRAGVFKSRNAGVLWTASHTGIRAARLDSFGIAPSSPLTIYAAVRHYALLKTTNGGGSWNKCPDFKNCSIIEGFVVHPADPKKLFFLARGRGEDYIYRSTDGVQAIKNVLHKDVTGIAGDSNNPNHIVASGKVYKKYWVDPGCIGLYFTSDWGETWTQTKIDNAILYTIEAVAFAPSDPKIIYAGGSRHGSKGILYVTRNGGASWTRITWHSSGIHAIAVDPKCPDIVYVGSGVSGTYRSADGGQTWIKCACPTSAYSIIVNTNNPQEVFIGGWKGIYQSKDRGLTWTDISEGLIDKNITHLEFHAASRTLFAGTYGGGIWKKKL